MCESVEVARILDVSGTLLKTTCRQNSALASAAVSIMAKIRMAEKAELPKSTLLQPLDHYALEKRNNPTPAVNMASSLDSSASSSYSSSPDSDNRDLDDLIGSVQGIEIIKTDNIANDFQSSDEEYSSAFYKRTALPTSDEEDDDEDLIERGPVRPQLHPLNRARPYVDSSIHNWPNCGVSQPNENSTDYDTSAKAILTDREYRQKIDFCLDKLSDSMSQERSATNSLSPAHSDFGGTSSGYSPPQQQQQQWSPGGQRSNGSFCFVPSITVCDSETSLLEILSRGGFQPAQASRTPEYNSGASVASSSIACASDNWPDSPASSYNNCATSASRPDSRASSRAQSPGSNNGCGGIAFLNVLGSPCMESTQVSPQNLRHLQRPSSSSSSSQSYCETPSPANYQNPLEQQLEEQLGDHMIAQLPVCRSSFESSDTIVNDSQEFQLQLVEEVIRGEYEQSKQAQSPCDMQVVPNCATTTPSCSSSNYTTLPSNATSYPMPSSVKLGLTSPNPSSYTDSHAGVNDDLTKTLLKFVGGEQTMTGQEKRGQTDQVGSNSTTSGYSSSSSSSEVWKACENACLQTDQQLDKSNLLGSATGSPRQQPQQQTVYQQHEQMSNAMGSMEGMQYASTSMTVRRDSWNSYMDTNPTMSGSNCSGSSFSEFQIPETVTSYNSQRSKSSNHSTNKIHSGGCLVEARIAPWPSLNLPKTRASERLKENTTPEAVQKAMEKLLKKPRQELTHADVDGDTMLMCLVGNPMELEKKLAYLVPLVERLGTIDGALTMLNNRGEDALYLAAMNCTHKPYVVGYLAAALVQKKIDIANKTYRTKGDTLVHVLAAKGDSHGDVLAELLSLKTLEGKPIFDLSRRNYDGRTALHVAVEAHVYHMALATTRLLLDNGVDPLLKEGKCGDTALHMAISLTCDPALVATLTNNKQGAQAVYVENYTGNTPLHLAGAINERTTIERQIHICKLLKLAGAHSNQPNRQGKTVLALVAPDRKEIIKRVFTGKC